VIAPFNLLKKAQLALGAFRPYEFSHHENRRYLIFLFRWHSQDGPEGSNYYVQLENLETDASSGKPNDSEFLRRFLMVREIAFFWEPMEKSRR